MCFFVQKCPSSLSNWIILKTYVGNFVMTSVDANAFVEILSHVFIAVRFKSLSKIMASNVTWEGIIYISCFYSYFLGFCFILHDIFKYMPLSSFHIHPYQILLRICFIPYVLPYSMLHDSFLIHVNSCFFLLF